MYLTNNQVQTKSKPSTLKFPPLWHLELPSSFVLNFAGWAQNKKADLHYYYGEIIAYVYVCKQELVKLAYELGVLTPNNLLCIFSTCVVHPLFSKTEEEGVDLLSRIFFLKSGWEKELLKIACTAQSIYWFLVVKGSSSWRRIHTITKSGRSVHCKHVVYCVLYRLMNKSPPSQIIIHY